MRWSPSPHHSDRRGLAPRWIVLHADVSPKEEATESWICSPASKVSYHVLVHRDGSRTRFVTDDRAAWACGESRWGHVVGLNRHSLSLAFANRHDGKEHLTARQIDAAIDQIDAWRQQFPIEGVLTHAMIAPLRKSDPLRIPNFSVTTFTEGLRP